jgi:hypothetical protein
VSVIDTAPALDLDTVPAPVRGTVRALDLDTVRVTEPGTVQGPEPGTVPAPERGIALDLGTVRGTVNDLRTVRVRNTVRVPRDTVHRTPREVCRDTAVDWSGEKIRAAETTDSL